MEGNLIYIGLALVLAAIGLYLTIRLIKKFSGKINLFLRDTLKEKQSDGYWKWSKGAIIIATAWYAVMYAFFFDLFKNGFNFEAFLVIAGIAIGAPITSSYSKKLNPLVTPPKEDEKA